MHVTVWITPYLETQLYGVVDKAKPEAGLMVFHNVKKQMFSEGFYAVVDDKCVLTAIPTSEIIKIKIDDWEDMQ